MCRYGPPGWFFLARSSGQERRSRPHALTFLAHTHAHVSYDKPL